MTLIYKLDKAPLVIQDVLNSLGWTEYVEGTHKSDQWNLMWKASRPSVNEFTFGKTYQKYNHFPKTGLLSTKDNLCRLMKKMRAVYGNIFDFTPRTYILPNEYKKFVEDFTQSEKTQIWICKPTDLSRGRKIFLINDIGDLKYDQQSVIQKYIASPLLIKGFKWDMRIYVLITKARPLQVYLYKEGIVRFSSEKYDTRVLKNVFSHLTNTSINKLATNQNFMGNTGNGGSGIKWTFEQLKNYLKDHGINWNELWVKIEKIIILTTINLATVIPDLDCCFELFGFDVIIDQNLKPWLLEVNSGPAMSMDNNIDYLIKPTMLKELFSMIQFEDYEKYQVRIINAYAQLPSVRIE